jgi:catechol 2,3-dioxygenase-like lactoylglutathione lyase family enzyme
MKLHHVQVCCPPGGEEAAREFYGTGLGLPEVAKPPGLAARGGVWFRAPGVELHVGVEEPFAPVRQAHPAFVVDDAGQLEQVARRLTAAGFTVDHRERDTFPGFLRFHTGDPHGNRVEVLAPARP